MAWLCVGIRLDGNMLDKTAELHTDGKHKTNTRKIRQKRGGKAAEDPEHVDAVVAVGIHTEILGVKIPMNTIPITPGRNLAVILEVAAMNNRQKKMGYNAALEFTEQINRHFDMNMGK